LLWGSEKGSQNRIPTRKGGGLNVEKAKKGHLQEETELEQRYKNKEAWARFRKYMGCSDGALSWEEVG